MINFFRNKLIKFINFLLLTSSFCFGLSVIDKFDKYLSMWNKGFNFELLIPILIGIVFLWSLFWYLSSLGRSSKKRLEGKILINGYDKIYTEIQVCILYFSILLFGYAINNVEAIFGTLSYYIGYNINLGTVSLYNFELIILAFINLLIVMCPIGTLLKRMKNKTFFTNTIIYQICLLIDNCIKKSTKYDTIYKQIKVRIITLFILALIPVLGWIMFAVLATKWNYRIAYDMELLKNGTGKIKDGDYDVTLDGLYTEVAKETAVNLNDIKNNINNIVEEKVKDEKSKIKLILDASYDLKNPLESIIENISILEHDPDISSKNKKCIETIKSRTERLTQLSNEISLGESKQIKRDIDANIKEVDIFSFIAKGLSEIELEMKKSNMNIKLNIKKSKILAYADENLLWRAFENLIKDVFKHGQKGTNVFISIEEVNGYGVISVRNEIKDELKDQMNISPDEFKKKYLSSDALNKRTSLVVTKSLIEKQGGALDIKIKENFFTAVLILKTVD